MTAGNGDPRMADVALRPATSPSDDRDMRVLVVDDRALVRIGIRCLLARARAKVIVEEAASPTEFAAALRVGPPDVVLLDADLDGWLPTETIRLVREEAPATRVIVLGLEPNVDEVRQAFAAGADGYVAKEGAAGELVSAIDEVASGRHYLDPRLGAELVLSWMEDPAEAGRTTGLTSDERQVLELVVSGLTSRQVAARLNRPLRTVEGVRARGQRKLGTRGRAELVERARRQGL